MAATQSAIVNYVAPAGAVVSASQFHTISWVEVMLSANPNDRDVYKQGQQGYGEDRVQLYALTGTALAKLMNAAGIKEVHSHRTDDGRHPYIVSWQFKGKWVQPDSTEIEYSADYTCDLRDWITLPAEDGKEPQRVRGARFEKAFVEDRDTLVKKKFPAAADWKKLYGDAAEKKIYELLNSLSKEEREVLEEAAEAFALRRIVQSRLFITQLAQTGAMDRVVRKFLNLKPTYTGPELTHPFSVPRSRFDWERMDAVLGNKEAGQLKMAQAMKLLGLTGSDMAQLKQLSAPAPVPEYIPSVQQPEPALDMTKLDVGEPQLPPSIPVQSPAPLTQEATRLGGIVIEEEAPEPPPLPEDEVSDTFEVFSEGVLDYRKWKMSGRVELQVFGKFRMATEQIGNTLTPGEKEQIKCLFMDGKTNKVNTFEMTGHLKKHFQVATVSAMTWEQMAALVRYKEVGASDKRWYPKTAVNPLVAEYGIADATTEDAVAFLEDIAKVANPLCLKETMAKHNLTWENDHERLRSLATVLANGVVEFNSADFESLAATGEVF